MTTVKIKVGVFGYNNKGVYELVPAGKTIEVEDALAHRLVEEKGVAEYVAPVPADEDAAADIARSQAAKSIEEMTKDELREIAPQYGLTFAANAKKSEMIEAIAAMMPVPADEDAPTFDATEAVQ